MKFEGPLFRLDFDSLSYLDRGIRKRFDGLLRCPLRRRMFRHVEVNNSPPVVGKHDEDEQHPKRSSRDNEKVDRYEIFEHAGPGMSST